MKQLQDANMAEADAMMERLVVENFRDQLIGKPLLSQEERERKERQRAAIEENLLKAEEEENRAAKQKVILSYIFIILFS